MEKLFLLLLKNNYHQNASSLNVVIFLQAHKKYSFEIVYKKYGLQPL